MLTLGLQDIIGAAMITNHAIERITNRLQGIITSADINHAMKVATMVNPRKHYIRIKQLPKTVYLDDSSGDCITAIVIDNRLVTMMLSHNNQRWQDGTFKVLLAR